MVRGSRIVEHPAEFHIANARGQGLRVTFDGEERVFITLFASEVEQILRIRQIVTQCNQRRHHAVKLLLFLAELLSTLRIAPDIRVFHFFVDDF